LVNFPRLGNSTKLPQNKGNEKKPQNKDASSAIERLENVNLNANVNANLNANLNGNVNGNANVNVSSKNANPPLPVLQALTYRQPDVLRAIPGVVRLIQHHGVDRQQMRRKGKIRQRQRRFHPLRTESLWILGLVVVHRGPLTIANSQERCGAPK
jgi:hypothetical protein